MSSLKQCINNDTDSAEEDSYQSVLLHEGERKSRKLEEEEDDDLPIVLETPRKWCADTGSVSSTIECSAVSNTKKDATLSKQLSCSHSNDQHQLNCSTLSDMFPQLPDQKIQEALIVADNNMDVAISHILDTTICQTTPQQVYASFDFCNDISDDDDFKPSDACIIKPCRR